jgi:CHRD domain
MMELGEATCGKGTCLMRSKSCAAGVVLLMIGVAACGSSSSSSSASKGASSSAKRAGSPRIYRAALSGSAEVRGAPTGRGAAVIAIHGSSQVCWRFAHLRGFTNATSADIHVGTTRKSGKVVLPLSTGTHLHHKGCAPVTATLAKAIEHSPGDYYVSITSAEYPRGAVRGQL